VLAATVLVMAGPLPGHAALLEQSAAPAAAAPSGASSAIQKLKAKALADPANFVSETGKKAAKYLQKLQAQSKGNPQVLKLSPIVSAFEDQLKASKLLRKKPGKHAPIAKKLKHKAKKIITKKLLKQIKRAKRVLAKAEAGTLTAEDLKKLAGKRRRKSKKKAKKAKKIRRKRLEGTKAYGAISKKARKHRSLLEQGSTLPPGVLGDGHSAELLKTVDAIMALGDHSRGYKGQVNEQGQLCAGCEEIKYNADSPLSAFDKKLLKQQHDAVVVGDETKVHSQDVLDKATLHVDDAEVTRKKMLDKYPPQDSTLIQLSGHQ